MKQAIHHLRTGDPVLSAIIERVGDYGIQFRPPDFETLVKSIVFQQLSGRVASVIFGRLATAVKGVVTPETVLKLRPSRMRSLGLSTQKTAYIRDLARPPAGGSPPPNPALPPPPPVCPPWVFPPRRPPSPAPPPATPARAKLCSQISPPSPTTRSSSASPRSRASASGPLTCS